MRPSMTLQRYLELASRLPAPTFTQVEAFVADLLYAHSWYKHLPILPPGYPLHIYLDPGAGMTRVVRSDQQFGVSLRTDKECYHHAWLPTEETRARFGFLSYKVVYPRSIVLPHDLPSLLDPALGIDVHLPKEAVEAGRVEVSGLIHPLSTNHHLILLQAEACPPVWPIQTGGFQQLAKVLERCRSLSDRRAPLKSAPHDAVLDDTTRWALEYSDWDLYQMLATERQRQRDGLVGAAFRATSFVHCN